MKIILIMIICFIPLGIVENTVVTENAGIGINIFRRTIIIKDREKDLLLFSERNKIGCYYVGKYSVRIIKPI
jgi:hypothetical protein